jgi:hypothetical protein
MSPRTIELDLPAAARLLGVPLTAARRILAGRGVHHLRDDGVRVVRYPLTLVLNLRDTVDAGRAA